VAFCIKASAPGSFATSSCFFVGGSFLSQEIENDAYGRFRSRAIDADVGDETPDQLIHDALASPVIPARSCHNVHSRAV
jgi:hypothetical protein